MQSIVAPAAHALGPTVHSAPWHLAAPGARVRRWGTVLPAATASELLVRGLQPLARRTRQALPARLIEVVESALGSQWLLPERAGGLRLGLVEADKPERESTFAGKLVRIGGGASCHVRVDDPSAPAEICELRLGESGWSLVVIDAGTPVALNGTPVEPNQQTPLAVEDSVETGTLRLTLLPEEAAPPVRPRIRLLELLAVSRGDPLRALGRGSDRWVEVRIGDWRGFLSLEEPWIAAAYRSLGYAAPDDGPAWQNPVDASLTAYALERLAQRVSAELEEPVEVGPLSEAGALAGLVEGQGGWLAARFVLEAPQAPQRSIVLWPAGWALSRPTNNRPEGLSELAFAVHVIAGSASLALVDLRQLAAGDVVIPDQWLPKRQSGGMLAGPVLLRLQRWGREGRLEPTGQGARIELAGDGWEDAEAMSGGTMSSLEEPEEIGGDLEEALEVTLSFELDRIAVPLKELTAWDEGNTIALERSPDGPVRVLLHHAGGIRVVGRGRVVVVDGKLGVQLEEWRPRSEVAGEP
ncbi:MAG: FliM/FliN family flagellar motor switch protein [Thermoanaerobaculia bacterium]